MDATSMPGWTPLASAAALFDLMFGGAEGVETIAAHIFPLQPHFPGERGPSAVALCSAIFSDANRSRPQALELLSQHAAYIRDRRSPDALRVTVGAMTRAASTPEHHAFLEAARGFALLTKPEVELTGMSPEQALATLQAMEAARRAERISSERTGAQVEPGELDGLLGSWESRNLTRWPPVVLADFHVDYGPETQIRQVVRVGEQSATNQMRVTRLTRLPDRLTIDIQALSSQETSQWSLYSDRLVCGAANETVLVFERVR